MSAETRVRGAEGLAFAEGARHCGLVRPARARQGLAARGKQCIMSVFMYTEYKFNTPEGVMQGFFLLQMSPSVCAATYRRAALGGNGSTCSLQVHAKKGNCHQ